MLLRRQPKRPAQRPSRLLTAVARSAVPLAVVSGLIAVAGLVDLVLEVVAGSGPYPVVRGIVFVAFFVNAVRWSISMRRLARAWDVAIAERRSLTRAA